MRKLIWVVGIVFFLGIILAAVAYYVTRDGPPPQDDDLRVERLDIPEKENAFYYFNLAAEQLNWPDDKPTKDRIYAILKAEEWDEQFVSQLLEQNAEALEYVRQGLACAECQVPAIKGADDVMPDYVFEWRRLDTLSSLQAVWLVKHGRDKEAVDQAMRTVRFGHMIEASGGSLTHHVLGCAAKAMGLDRLRSLIVEITLEPRLLTQYARDLAQYEADEEGLKKSFKVEYAVAKNTIDDMAAGKLGLADLGLGEGDVTSRRYTGYFFQPNKTKRIFAQIYRTCISNVPRVYAQRDYSGLPEFLDDSGSLSTAKLILFGNPIGKMLVVMLTAALESPHQQKCQENVSVGATQLLLALKAYKLETGELPESLDKLVPEYLEAVPIDDFDGRPIRYSPEKRIIYSIGTDLKDSGGSEAKEPWDREEPTFPIEF